MNKQEFNRLAAEFLGCPFEIMKCGDDEIIFIYVNKDGIENESIFNPYDDANDMLLLEDKMKMYALPPIKDGDKWTAFTRDTRFDFNQISGYGDTPHEARRACAEEYLKEWKK